MIRRLAPLAVALLLLAGRVASACPLCADSNTNAQAQGGGTSVWWAVGAFLLVPPILGAFVLGFLRRELGARKERDAAAGAAIPAGLPRFGA